MLFLVCNTVSYNTCDEAYYVLIQGKANSRLSLHTAITDTVYQQTAERVHAANQQHAATAPSAGNLRAGHVKMHKTVAHTSTQSKAEKHMPTWQSSVRDALKQSF